MKKWFKLFSSCVVVNGNRESLICDLERNEFYDLPNEFKEILIAADSLPLEVLVAQYGEDVRAFLNQFVEMEVGFYTAEPELFPKIDLTWDSPHRVNNAIIELSNKSNYDYSKTIKELDNLGTIGYQFRFLDSFDEDKIRNILSLFLTSRAVYIEILMPFNEEIEYLFLERLFEDFPRLIIVKIYGSPKFGKLNTNVKNGGRIFFLEKNILVDSKEIISQDRFVTEVGFFAEAQKHNLGLNRKVSITQHGEIKNYPNHFKSFGKVNEVEISTLIEQEDFNYVWYISNDQIEICRDCQYRYICVSNSEIKENKKQYTKIDICNFNPYENIWN